MSFAGRVVNVSGLPITFLDRHNPDQFEIVCFRKGNDDKDLAYMREGESVQPYFRIIIRRKNSRTEKSLTKPDQKMAIPMAILTTPKPTPTSAGGKKILRSGRRGRGFKSRHPDSGQGKHLDRFCFAREAG